MKIAFVYPGQGSQHVGMGHDLHEKFAEVRALYEEANATLGYDLRALSFKGPEEKLNQTVRTQPSLLAASIAAHRVLVSMGITPSAVAGHSLGEYSALVAAGVFSFREALMVTEMRGRIMQEAVPEGVGLMAAVLGLDRGAVDGACGLVKSGYVAAANYNCPGQVVISGEKAAVEEAMRILKEKGARRVVPLPVSVPSHSRLMDDASKKLSEFLFLGEIKLNAPNIPVVSNSDALLLSTAEGVTAALVKQLNSPVLWEFVISTMVHFGIDTFIEVGPGRVLSGIIRRCEPDVRIFNVQDSESLASTLRELGR